jgi:hypothetical protein
MDPASASLRVIRALKSPTAVAQGAIDTAVRRLGPLSVRPVSDDMRYPLISRAGNTDPVATSGQLYALDPVAAVAGGYADPEWALKVARASGLQMLDASHPRGPAARSFDGLYDREVPLYMYPGRSYLKNPGDTGMASTEPPFWRMAEVAALGRSPDEIMETVRHESAHLLDPLMYGNTRIPAIDIRSRAANKIAQEYDPLGWQDRAAYWSNQAEMHATLSRLRRLTSRDHLVTTPQQAKQMLAAAVPSGSSGSSAALSNDEARAAFTAAGILRSKYALEKLMPWMTGALSAGGVAAGTNSMEEP